MTLARARVLRASVDAPRPVDGGAAGHGGPRRVPSVLIEAREEAARIVAEARAEAARAVRGAAEEAAREAREAETAKLAAGWLALRQREEASAALQQERIVGLATALAERLLGASLALDPVRIAELAVTAMQEARGARTVRIDASPADAPALREALGVLDQTAAVHEDPALGRGSLVVHTDLGKVDARIAPQLARLADALREALR